MQLYRNEGYVGNYLLKNIALHGKQNITNLVVAHRDELFDTLSLANFSFGCLIIVRKVTQCP